METDLTKRIKELTHRYSPKIKSQMRTIRWADEVWTPTGIVDSIRFEDYYASEEYTCPFLNPSKFDADRLLQAERAVLLVSAFGMARLPRMLRGAMAASTAIMSTRLV